MSIAPEHGVWGPATHTGRGQGPWQVSVLQEWEAGDKPWAAESHSELLPTPPRDGSGLHLELSPQGAAPRAGGEGWGGGLPALLGSSPAQFLHDPLTPRTPVAGPGSVDGPIHCHWSWRSKQNLRPQPLAICGWPHTSSSSHQPFPSQVLLPVFSASQCFPLDGSTILKTSVPG